MILELIRLHRQHYKERGQAIPPFILGKEAAITLLKELAEEGTYNRKKSTGISKAVFDEDLTFLNGMFIYDVPIIVERLV